MKEDRRRTTEGGERRTEEGGQTTEGPGWPGSPENRQRGTNHFVAPAPDLRSLSPEDRAWPEGRLRQKLARKKRCCENCVYATRPGGRWLRLVLVEFAGLFICANSAEAPGELRGVPGCSTCPNYRAKRRPTVQAAPPPPQPPDGAFFYIPVTQGQQALVDAEDYARVRRHKWCLSRSGHQLYAQCRYRGKTIRMHQFIMNPPQGMVVDHIDGNGLNNRRGNLRLCTPEQNIWNQKRRKPQNASSQYMGVHRYRGQPDRWYVKIQCRGQGRYLGPFDEEIEAARARDRLALQFFGEFARLNFPREDYLGGQPTENGEPTTENGEQRTDGGGQRV